VKESLTAEGAEGAEKHSAKGEETAKKSCFARRLRYD
jgi:hypothetical protein